MSSVDAMIPLAITRHSNTHPAVSTDALTAADGIVLCSPFHRTLTQYTGGGKGGCGLGGCATYRLAQHAVGEALAGGVHALGQHEQQHDGALRRRLRVHARRHTHRHPCLSARPRPPPPRVSEPPQSNLHVWTRPNRVCTGSALLSRSRLISCPHIRAARCGEDNTAIRMVQHTTGMRHHWHRIDPSGMRPCSMPDYDGDEGWTRVPRRPLEVNEGGAARRIQ